MKNFFLGAWIIAFIGFVFLIGLGQKEENIYRCLVMLTLGFGGLIELYILVLMYRNYEAIAQAATCEIKARLNNTPTPRVSKYPATAPDSTCADRAMREWARDQRRRREKSEAWYFRW